MATGLEWYLTRQGLLDLLLHAVEIKNGPLPRVVLHQCLHVGDVLTDKLDHIAEGFAGINPHLFHPGSHFVPQGAHGQRQITVNQGNRGGAGYLVTDGTPQPPQKIHIPAQRILFRAFSRRAQDKTFLGDVVPFFQNGVHNTAQPFPLLVIFNALGDTDMVGIGHVHQKTGRHRQMSGEPGTFGADHVLGDLYHDGLAFRHQIRNIGGSVAAVLRLVRLPDVLGVQERRPFQSNIHERCLHTRQHPGHFALVDTAHQAALGGALHEQLLNHTVFHHRNPGFHGGYVDQ